eukprot:scaffold2578_cov370-Prasinococcus_capsulatus_cf.AAC.8
MWPSTSCPTGPGRHAGRPHRSCACRSQSALRWPRRPCGQTWLQSRCPLRNTWSRSPRHHPLALPCPARALGAGARGWGAPPP